MMGRMFCPEGDGEPADGHPWALGAQGDEESTIMAGHADSAAY
jgi:hypothetical protein